MAFDDRKPRDVRYLKLPYASFYGQGGFVFGLPGLGFPRDGGQGLGGFGLVTSGLGEGLGFGGSFATTAIAVDSVAINANDVIPINFRKREDIT